MKRVLSDGCEIVLIGSVLGSSHYIALVVPEQVSATLDRFLTMLPLAVPA